MSKTQTLFTETTGVSAHLAALSSRAALLAAEIEVSEKDECAVALKLAIFHLRSAAKKLQSVAEFKVQREKA